MNGYPIVEKYFLDHLRATTRGRVDSALKHIPNAALLTASRAIARALLYRYGAIERDAALTLRACFPHLSDGELRALLQEHMGFVVLNMFMLPILSASNDAQFDARFTYDGLEEALAACGDRRTVFVASHFYTHVTTPLMADIFRRRGQRLCMTFQVRAADHDDRFLERARHRFFANHVVINAGLGPESNFADLFQYVKDGRGPVFLFGDIRFKKHAADLPFRVGAETLYASGALRMVLAQCDNQTAIVPMQVIYEAGRFRARFGSPLDRARFLERYYDQILPEQINAHRAQWQLWYLADALLRGAVPRAVRGEAIANAAGEAR